MACKGSRTFWGSNAPLLVVWSCFGATIIFLALTPSVLGNNSTHMLPGILLGSALLMVMILDHLLKPIRRRVFGAAGI